MKRFPLLILAALTLGLSVVACLPDVETPQEIFDRDLQKIDKYIVENNLSGVKEHTEEGAGIVMFWETVSGSGATVNKGDTLHIDYTGYLLDGTVFDTSFEDVAIEEDIYDEDRGGYEPIEIKYLSTGMIEGFNFALSKMEEGDVATVIIPSYFGYGNSQAGMIPANSVLIFDIYLRAVNPTNDETND